MKFKKKYTALKKACLHHYLVTFNYTNNLGISSKKECRITEVHDSFFKAIEEGKEVPFDYSFQRVRQLRVLHKEIMVSDTGHLSDI